MISFKEWLNERHGKLVAMRRWMWNQEHGHFNQKNAPPPVSKGDPDYNWIVRKANLLGSIDPLKHS
jgi:hypothetical protein